MSSFVYSVFYMPTCNFVKFGLFQDAHERNDTVIQFRSPTVNNFKYQPLTTWIRLDNWEKELKPFEYHPDPTFNNVTKKVITEASIIIVTVSTGCSGLFKNALDISYSPVAAYIIKKVSLHLEMIQIAANLIF